MPAPGPLIFGPPIVTEVGSIGYVGLASPPPAAPAVSVTDQGSVVLTAVFEVDSP